MVLKKGIVIALLAGKLCRHVSNWLGKLARGAGA